MKKNLILFLLAMLTISVTTMSHGTPETTDTVSQNKLLGRGSAISLEELATIADLSSARDEKGNPVTLEEGSYQVGSFKRTTISVVPNSGKADDVITLNLK